MKSRLPAVLFLAIVAVMTVRLLLILTEPGVAEGGYVDFRDAIHAPAAALLDGVDPYNTDALLAHDPGVGNPFDAYAPHHLLLALPLAVMPLAAAGVVWWVLNLALLLGVCTFVVHRVRPAWGVTGVLGLAALTLISNPGRFNFLTGQPTLAMVLGTYLAFSSPNPWLAAGGTALALIKPQFGLPVLLLLLAAGRWRAAAGGTALASVLALPVVAVLGVMEGGLGNLIRAVTDNVSSSNAQAVSEFRVDLVGSFMRLTGTTIGIPGHLLVFLALVSAGAWLLRRHGKSDAAGLTVVGLVTVLSLFHLPYDLLILLWPLTSLVAGVRRSGRWRWWTAGFLVAAVFNPLTVETFGIGRGLDTVTTALLVAAFLSVLPGLIVRRAHAGVAS